jgi:hypothetical protein
MEVPPLTLLEAGDDGLRHALPVGDRCGKIIA